MERPELQALLEDARAGKFPGVVVHKTDRFSRKLRDILNIVESLKEMGIAFWTINHVGSGPVSTIGRRHGALQPLCVLRGEAGYLPDDLMLARRGVEDIGRPGQSWVAENRSERVSPILVKILALKPA